MRNDIEGVSNCEDICEGHGYDAAQCAAVSSSCAWNNGACWSGVGSASCSYFPGQTNPLASGCSEHADCGSDEYCYDTGYYMTGTWSGVGSCSGFPTHCCGGAEGNPIDRDIGNCPAASQCESETATASNCEDICEGHGYDEAQCVAVSSSCAWNNSACGSGVGSASCSYFPAQSYFLRMEHCYDVDIMTGEWNGVGYCGVWRSGSIGTLATASQCESETATASNCEDICEDHG